MVEATADDEWDLDLAHQPPASLAAHLPKRSRGTGISTADNMWVDVVPPPVPRGASSAGAGLPHSVAMSTLFQCPVGVLSRTPAAVHPGVGDALAVLLRKVAEEPSEIAAWALMAFPNLVLRASARGGGTRLTL